MYKKHNSQFGKEVITIFPGELCVTITNEILSTVLGSCIAVCLYDSKSKVYGMNHFMLPETRIPTNFDKLMENPSAFSNADTKYGTVSMDRLIGELQKSGAKRENLKAKVFGGGNVLKGTSEKLNVGEKNIKFIESYLKLERIPILSQSTGDIYGRKIFFIPETEKVLLKRIHSQMPEPVLDKEKILQKEISSKNGNFGDVELFV